jgi:hypothetical protein
MHGKQHEKGAFVQKRVALIDQRVDFTWHTIGFELETFLEVLRSFSMGYMHNIYYIYH